MNMTTYARMSLDTLTTQKPTPINLFAGDTIEIESLDPTTHNKETFAVCTIRSILRASIRIIVEYVNVSNPHENDAILRPGQQFDIRLNGALVAVLALESIERQKVSE